MKVIIFYIYANLVIIGSLQVALMYKMVNAASPNMIDLFLFIASSVIMILLYDKAMGSKETLEAVIDEASLKLRSDLVETIKEQISIYCFEDEGSPLNDIGAELESLKHEASRALDELKDQKELLSRQMDESKRLLSNFNFGAMWHRKP